MARSGPVGLLWAALAALLLTLQAAPAYGTGNPNDDAPIVKSAAASALIARAAGVDLQLRAHAQAERIDARSHGGGCPPILAAQGFTVLPGVGGVDRWAGRTRADAKPDTIAAGRWARAPPATG